MVHCPQWNWLFPSSVFIKHLNFHLAAVLVRLKLFQFLLTLSGFRLEPVAFTHRNRNTETVDGSCRSLVVLKMGTYRLFESAIFGGLEDYLVGLKALFCQKS